MKFTQSSTLAALVGLAAASPTPTINKVDARAIAKRATISDAADIGFASTNGGTTGGAGGTTTTVTSLADFTAAAEADEPLVIVVDGQFSGSAKVRVGSDKTIVGKKGASLENIGLYINKQKNVIIRNLIISKVQADNGDAIGVQASSNVWVDHVELFSDLDNGKDYYDGLFDVTHASEWVTLSNSYLHDHYKGSLVGHSDSNADEDTGTFHVTYANNHFSNIGSRNPSVRFGNVHIFNGYYENLPTSGINTRMGSKLLIESVQFVDAKRAITSLDSKEVGTAVVKDVDLGGSTNDVEAGEAPDVSYEYTLLGSGSVKAAVVGTAGATLDL